MKTRGLTKTMRSLVERQSLSAVLGALTDVCGERVEKLLGARTPTAEAARPWSRVGCKLEELAIYSREEQL